MTYNKKNKNRLKNNRKIKNTKKIKYKNLKKIQTKI